MATETIVLRLLLIMLLSSLIGIQREYYRKPAGLRTNVIVGLAATLITITSTRTAELFHGIQGHDPTRITSNIITGIGFIGAGAILRYASTSSNRNKVVGITTAATLWLVTGIGIAVGFGFYLEAILATGLTFFTFVIFTQVVQWIRKYSEYRPPSAVSEEED